MDKLSANLEAPEDLPIYPIRTVAQLSGVDARRLRSWEAEYQLLHPARTQGGHRLYSARDLKLIQEIRRLVDEEGMSLQGIRAWLAARPNGSPLAKGTPEERGVGQPTGAAQGTRSESPSLSPARTPARLEVRR